MLTPAAPQVAPESNLIEEAKSQNLLILGDSLSAAYGIDQQQGWVTLLQKKLREGQKYQAISVQNASISGETTSGGKQRLPKLMQRFKPRWLVLELGANDALRGQNLHVTQRNLETMIQSCLRADFECNVMLLGIRLPTNYGPAYEQFLQQVYAGLASQYQLVFDPFFLQAVALDPDLMQPDGLHPNAKAQPFILQQLWPKFELLMQNTLVTQ